LLIGVFVTEGAAEAQEEEEEEADKEEEEEEDKEDVEVGFFNFNFYVPQMVVKLLKKKMYHFQVRLFQVLVRR